MKSKAQAKVKVMLQVNGRDTQIAYMVIDTSDLVSMREDAEYAMEYFKENNNELRHLVHGVVTVTIVV